MTQTLMNFLNGAKNKEFATKNGTRMHAVLQKIVIDDNDVCGNKEIIKNILQHIELKRFFTKNAYTEMPIAGNINGRFISRRIDRILINKETKIIDFIDYKTDTNINEFIDKYRYQLNEYKELLCSAYPDFVINGYILWLHNWRLEKII